MVAAAKSRSSRFSAAGIKRTSPPRHQCSRKLHARPERPDVGTAAAALTPTIVRIHFGARDKSLTGGASPASWAARGGVSAEAGDADFGRTCEAPTGWKLVSWTDNFRRWSARLDPSCREMTSLPSIGSATEVPTVLDISSGNGWVLLAAFLAGAGGGLAAALILLDPSESTTPPPSGATAWKVVSIRTVVGAVAAMAFLFFFPTTQQTTVVVGGHSATVTVYPFLKVIALGLVVGTGGSAFLTAMRNQANSFINAANANKAAAQIKATSVTALSMLPAMGAQVAKADAALHAQTIKDVATAELTKTAEALPSQLGMVGVDPQNQVRQAFADVTGLQPNQVTLADVAPAISSVAFAVNSFPESIESSVGKTLQSRVNEIIEEINSI
jgi:hypothetical protein